MSAGRSRHRGDALVAGQVLALVGLAWPGAPRWRLPRPVVAAAVLTGAAGTALLEEGLRFLGGDTTPFVEPRGSARLRTWGPYAYTRNPVYVGLLAAAASAAVLRRRPEPLAATALLAAVLHVKVGQEERRLRDRFGVAYEEYAARTPRLVALPRPDRGTWRRTPGV